MALRSRTYAAAAILATALVAWIVTVQRMRGMDAGPGTDLGGLGWFVGIWVTMTAAMMLPSAAPAVMTFARFRRGARVTGFVVGYLGRGRTDERAALTQPPSGGQMTTMTR